MSVGSYAKQSADGGMITLRPSIADVKAFTEFAAVVPKAAAAAQRRAINKTLRWLVTHISRAVGRKERIAISAVRQRLRAFPIGSNGQGKLWFGINPLESSRIGRPKKGLTSVSVAGRRYQGAFFEKVYGGKADIWIRTGSKHFNTSDYPSGDESGGISGSDSRLSLAKAKVSLEDVTPLFEEWVARAEERLVEVLQQELNFELQKFLKGSRS